MKLHGIVNCDTVKKARAWLDARAVPYEWVDFRKAPPSFEDLARWCRVVGWKTLLNRRGTTWRALDDAAMAAAVDERSAIALMAAQPFLLMRNLWYTHDRRGSFVAHDYAARLKN